MKTLRLVNSVYYGLSQKVSTVEHAVVLLGAKVVKNMVLSAAAFDTMRHMSAGFMRHSVACGMAMRALAEAGPLGAHFATPSEAFTYGLLHDIGKVLLHGFLAQACDEVLRLAAERGSARHEAEREVIGADHAELGARLAAKWKLEPPLVAAIAGHHDLARADEAHRQVAANLCVANYLASVCGFPCDAAIPARVPGEVWSVAGLDNPALYAVMERLFAIIPDMGELLAINE